MQSWLPLRNLRHEACEGLGFDVLWKRFLGKPGPEDTCYSRPAPLELPPPLSVSPRLRGLFHRKDHQERGFARNTCMHQTPQRQDSKCCTPFFHKKLSLEDSTMRRTAGALTPNSSLSCNPHPPAPSSVPLRDLSLSPTRRFQEFRDELRDLPLGPGGSLQRLSNIAQFLFDREKPDLVYQSPVKKSTGIISNVRGKVSKLFAPLQVLFPPHNTSRE